MMNRIVVFLLSAAPVIASAQAVVTPTMGPALTGPKDVVANGPGNQYDPHVSGPWVAYTDDSSGGSEIRYHNLDTRQDAAVPSTNGLDSLSAISGQVLVYNHFTASSA